MTDAPVPMQRLGLVARVPRLLTELGKSPEAVLAGFPLQPGVMHPDMIVPFHLMFDLFARCEAATGRDDFGLMLGDMAQMSDFGAVGEVCKVAPTLGRALSTFVSLQMSLSQGLATYLMALGDCRAMGVGIYDRHGPGVIQMYGVSIAAISNGIRALTGGAVAPVEIHLSHRAPADPRRYERVLRGRVLFNQPQTCALLSEQSLSVPNPNGDAARFVEEVAALRRTLGLERSPVSVRLRHMLRPALGDGAAALTDLAWAMGMSSRTLSRKLSQEGTTFEEERDRMRHTMASELLALTDLKVGDIAASLGFANHAAFDRAFRRWSGTTPMAWRGQA